jgi:hypothetical protein
MVIDALFSHFNGNSPRGRDFARVAMLYRLAQLAGEDTKALSEKVLGLLASGELAEDLASGDSRPSNWVSRGKFYLAIAELFQVDVTPFIQEKLRVGVGKAIWFRREITPADHPTSDDIHNIILAAHMAAYDITDLLPQLYVFLDKYSRSLIPDDRRTEADIARAVEYKARDEAETRRLLAEYRPFPGATR